jgi:hypothetical protein
MLPFEFTAKLPLMVLAAKLVAALLVSATLLLLVIATVVNWLLALLRVISFALPALNAVVPATEIAPVCVIAPLLVMVKLPTLSVIPTIFSAIVLASMISPLPVLLAFKLVIALLLANVVPPTELIVSKPPVMAAVLFSDTTPVAINETLLMPALILPFTLIAPLLVIATFPAAV